MESTEDGKGRMRSQREPRDHVLPHLRNLNSEEPTQLLDPASRL